MVFQSNDNDDVMAQIEELFGFAFSHARDAGHEITIKYSGPNAPGCLKRVDAEGRIVWYEWLAGAKRWGYCIEEERFEFIYQAGISTRLNACACGVILDIDRQATQCLACHELAM